MSSFRACGWVNVGGVKGCVNGCTTGVEGCTRVVLSPPMTFCWCSRKIYRGLVYDLLGSGEGLREHNRDGGHGWRDHGRLGAAY